MGLRKKEIKIRVCESELAALQAKRGKMRLATWLRTCALNSVPPSIPQINQTALTELHRIGSNLNQLARSANAGDTADLLDLRAQVSDLRAALAGAKK